MCHRFSEIPKEVPSTSAPIIEHPEQPDEPAYKVSVLVPAPSPLPAANPKSATATPAASHVPTPRSEPLPAERVLTVTEVTSIFLKSLLKSAEDFLGKHVDGAVISVPPWFDHKARVALEKAAGEAGVKVLQLLDEAGAASLVSVTYPSDDLEPDRTALLVDLGQSSLYLSLLSFRHGLMYSLASSYNPQIGGEQIDAKLIKFFAKEFTKKTKTPLTVCPASNNADKRAETKMRLAIEHTKRTISASPGTATCSVESLKDGLDFTGTITRLRFDMEMRPIYDSVVNEATTLLSSVGLEPLHVDEIVYVGGSASLPGLDETFFTRGFSETMVTPFTAGTVIGGGSGDPTTLLARGCALQAKILAEIAVEETALKEAFHSGSGHIDIKATTKSLGIIFPEDVSTGDDTTKPNDLGGQWVLGVPRETPLPYRRVVQFDCDVSTADEKKVGFEVWEVSDVVNVEKIKPPKLDDDEDPEEEEEEEEIELREKSISKETYHGSVSMVSKHAEKSGERWKTRLEVQFVAAGNGAMTITAREVYKNGKGEAVALSIQPPA